MKTLVIGAFVGLLAMSVSAQKAHANDAENALFESVGAVLYFMEVNERIRQQCDFSMLTMHDILRVDEIFRDKTGFSYFEALDLVSAEGVDREFFDEEALELVDLLGCTPALLELWSEMQRDTFTPAVRTIWSYRG